MRTYELVLIFDPSLEMEQIESDLQKLNEMITTNGLPRKWERWGKRRLAYEIKSRQYGYYAIVTFDMNNPSVAELERSVRLNVAVIRHLLTILEASRAPEVDEESVRTLGAGAAAPEAEEAAKPAVEGTEAEIPEVLIPDEIEPDSDNLPGPIV